MPNRPLVSVVTPTLSQAQFLDRTLASVRRQTYPNIEHIVVDGGSTDGTLDILRREGAAGSLRWTSEPDGGMYDALNKGIDTATGEILAYLNSDDAWLPWAVERVMQVFVARRDVDIVFGDGIKVDEEIGKQRLRLFPPFDRISLANYESLMQPAVFWRRRLAERIGGFDTGMRYVADLDYWLRAAEAGARIVHVREVLAVERIHAARLSSAQREAMAAEDGAMRARHTGEQGGPAGRERSREREFRWQRWLWRGFVAAATFRWAPGPWHRFLRDAGVTVRRRRALRGSQPHESRLLWGAVTSDLAAAVLRGEGEGEGEGERASAV